MKRLITSDASSYSTGDEVANAVCHYARVLARAGITDVVEIPVRVALATQRVELTIGWRAGVVAVPTSFDGSELEDIVTVLDIYSRAARVLPRGEPFTDDDIDRMRWPEL